MQRGCIVEKYLPLELRSTDVILGMQWLGTLGNMKISWKLLTMKFRMGETLRVLKGDFGLSKAGIPLKTMVKTLQREGHGV